MGLFLRLTGLLVALILVVAGGGLVWLFSSLPQLSGELVVPGLNEPVRIVRDAAGVPTIHAASDIDAAYGLGFVHAQDRLFQMDLQRRFGSGRLSEVMGSVTVDSDRTMRALGLRRAAEAQLDVMSPALRAAVEAYGAGINAYITQRRGALPPEYTLLRSDFEPWEPGDTMIWGKLMALQLAGNFRGELLRARIAQRVSPDDMAILYPAYPKDGATALAGLVDLYRTLPLDDLARMLPAQIGPTYASNNWVVSGARTVTGKPILANDPHLGFAAPGTWYYARLVTPTLSLSGITAPGTPLVVIGHNDRIAWGMTTTTGDVEDIFVERVDPADPSRYIVPASIDPSGSKAFETRDEEIRVRGADPVKMTVRSTRHGPVISDALGATRGAVPAGHVLALASTVLRSDDRTPDALFALNRARDWAGFNKALENFAGPQQSIVYADVDGNIGFLAPALIPIRRQGDGFMPVPGWTDDYDWVGYIPFADLPRAFNPPDGKIVTANNRVVPENYPYFISRDWDAPYRAQRIADMLAARPVQTVRSTAEIQADNLSLMARDLLPLMLAATPAAAASPVRLAALERLRGWDANMTGAAAEPLIFTAWLRETTRTFLSPRLGEFFDEYWDLKPRVVKTILTAATAWCDDPLTSPVETCSEQLAGALDRALGELVAKHGQDMANWRWDVPHRAQFPHLVLSRVPVLRDLVQLSIPSDGGYDTVNRGNTSIRNRDTPFANVHGAGLRIIFDLADLDGTVAMVVPGQSGNPLSRHFGDLMELWRDFDWLQPSRAAGVTELTLKPRRP